MDKRKEIEGTKERAADRGQPFGLEFFEQETDDRLYLGDPDHVDMILREFMGGCADAMREGGVEGLEKHCAKYADTFYGRDKGVRTMGTFNSPTVLGNFLRKTYGVDASPEGAAALFLQHIAVQTLKAMTRLYDGEIDKEAYTFLLDAALDEATTGMMGLPPSTSEDD